MKKRELPKCKYCGGIVQMLKTDNHIIGCNLESIAMVIRFRGYDIEADNLDEIASRIK